MLKIINARYKATTRSDNFITYLIDVKAGIHNFIKSHTSSLA